MIPPHSNTLFYKLTSILYRFGSSFVMVSPNTNNDYSKALRRPLICSCSIATLAILVNPTAVVVVGAFQPYRTSAPTSPTSAGAQRCRSQLYFSTRDGPPSPPPGDNNDDDDMGLGDFLIPKKESDSLKRAREYMSETSLPISFDDPQTSGDDEEILETEKDEDMEQKMSQGVVDPSSSAMVGAFGTAPGGRLFGLGDGQQQQQQQPSEAVLAKNPYMQVVSKIAPSDLIAKFTRTASPRVQDAVRTTVLGLIGSLPKMAFETTTITTGQRLASLMFQLQMTGYMLKNADYRLSLSQSLGMNNGSVEAYSSSLLLLKGDVAGLDHDDEEDPLTSGKIKGKIKVRYAGSNLFGTTAATGKKKSSIAEKSSSSSVEDEEGVEIEVDAAAYMSELRSEVAKLKDELGKRSEAKEEAVRKDLLLYIRTLPAQELRSLTNTMSQDVLVCMKGLVQAVLAGIGDGKIGPDTVTEQSGEAMAQLCMWQLAVGYNLRELEVREEMKKSLQNILHDDFEGGLLDGNLE